MNVSSVKNLNGETFSAVQDATLTDVVQSNSGNWNNVSNKLDTTAFSDVSGTFLTAHQSLDGYATEYWVTGQGYITGVSIPESATWQDVSTTVQTNSAQWGQGGSSDTFYIYPGKTTDKEISENSGKYLKLYNSANNVFLDFAGKSTLSKYTMFSFKEITGTQSNQNTVQHLRLRVYPNATSACKVYDNNTVNLLDSNSTVSTAQTAYYDGDGNYLTQTHNELTALNSFVQSNSANWGGGSSPVGGSVLFHYNYSYDPNNGSYTRNSYISGANDLYFESYADLQQGTPSDIVITRYGNEVGRIYWNQVSSDGNNNYFTAFYNNVDGEEIGLQNNGAGYVCYVSANGAKTYAFTQRSYSSTISNSIKFNIQGYNITGRINGLDQGQSTILTSFTGGLTDFTSNGYDNYEADVGPDDYNQQYSYDITAVISEGGSSVASGDVFPPTNNLEPQTTYYLGWNANNGGLFWYHP